MQQYQNFFLPCISLGLEYDELKVCGSRLAPTNCHWIVALQNDIVDLTRRSNVGTVAIELDADYELVVKG